MSGMDDRRKSFENKFAHDAELQFRVAARRNKLLGLWLADKLGEEDPAAYARSVVAADLEEAGDEDVIRKVMGDIKAKGAAVTEAEIRAQLTASEAEAKVQIMKETAL